MARRMPGLLLLLVAALLAFLLPSALTVPNSNPSSLAEFAPVPGQGQGRSDVSDLGQAGSGSLGSGRGSGTTAAESSPPPGLPSTKSRLKRCVGNPLRQTEDPLSPPCVAFFEGDNGGSMGKGVSGDEVTVVWPQVSGYIDEQGSRTETVNCGDPFASNDLGTVRICKSYMRFFNQRYQTYGRVVRLWHSHYNVPDQEIEARRKPFAVTTRNPLTHWAQRGSVGVGYGSLKRSTYQEFAPRLIGYRPDLQDQAKMVASFVCSKLAGRPARFSGNVTDRSATRKFAYWSETSPPYHQHRDAVRQELLDQCGLKPMNMEGDNPTAVASMIEEGITTVLLDFPGTAVTMAEALGQASRLGWFPEWVIPGPSDGLGSDVNSNARQYDQAQWKQAFGISFHLRRATVPEQPWYQAFKEGCPDCDAPRLDAQEFYETLSMLFYGIQAAGPRLTPQNIDKGMHAIPPRGSSDPYRPAAYFSAGNYTFIKDAIGIWWDPTGTAPGSSVLGCYRLLQSGTRRRPSEWPSGDADIQNPQDAPCQGDVKA